MVAKVNERTSFNISLSYLIQIVAVISIAVFGYANMSERIEKNAREMRNVRGNQNNYIFPDIRQLETKVIKLEKEVIILQTEIEFYKKELKEIQKPVK